MAKRRSLSEILSDESFDTSATDDGAAFDTALAAAEPQRRREEQEATDQVMENLNSRGLVRSGITLKDIVTQVLGPSTERSGQLAANFGLERARSANESREAARGRRLSAILQSDQGDLSEMIAEEDRVAREREAMANRRTSRQNALLSAGGGVLGSVLAKK